MNNLKFSVFYFGILLALMNSSFGQVKTSNNIYSTASYNENRYSIPAKNKLNMSSTDSSITLPIIKPDFIVNELNGNYGAEQTNPVMAIDSSGNYAVTWIDYRSGNKEIFAQFFNSQDQKIGPNILVSDFSMDWNNNPSIAANKKGDFIITWTQNEILVFAQRFRKTGEKIGVNFRVNASSADITGIPSVAVSDNGYFLITWSTNDLNFKSNMYARVFDTLGRPLSAEIMVNDSLNQALTSFGQGNRAAADGRGNFGIIWDAYYNAKSEIYFQKINYNNNKIGRNVIITDLSDSTMHSFPSIAATEDGHYMLVWEFYGNHSMNLGGDQARIYNNDGSFVTNQFNLYNSTTGFSTCYVSSNRKDQFITVCGGGGLLQYKRFQSNGSLLNFVDSLRFNTTDHLDQGYFFNSNIVGSYFYLTISARKTADEDIYVQKFNLNGSAVNSLVKVNDDAAPPNQTDPVVCYNTQGNYIVLWQDRRRAGHDIYAQVFDNNNNPVAGNLKINDSQTNRWPNSTIGVQPLSDGDFIVAFTIATTDVNANIYLQKISSSGMKINSNHLVDDVSGICKIAMNISTKDQILICWYSLYSFGNGAYLEKFDKNLTPLTSTVHFMSPVANIIRNPMTISVNSNLKVFASWMNSNPTNYMNDSIIYGEIFNDYGAMLSGLMILGKLNKSYSVSYLENCLSDENDKDYVISWIDYFGLNIKRYYYNNSNDFTFKTVLSDYGLYNSPYPRMLIFKNRKLFITASADKMVKGYYINDNDRTRKSFTIHEIDTISGSPFPYENFHNNYSALNGNRLVCTFESNKNVGTGYDIWANVQGLDDANFNPEKFLLPVAKDILYPNYPNPFNARTKIQYTIFAYHWVKLTIFDVMGREVKVLIDKPQEQGFYEVDFDASDLASGVYFCRLEAFDTDVKKLLVLK